MNNVYVLGSGFSSCGGAPVLREVLPNIFGRNSDARTAELKDYLQELLFSGQQEDWIYTSTLEEILSRLDLIKFYHPYQNINYHLLSFYEDMLLEKFTDQLSPASTKWQHDAYKSFREILTPDDVIISFNYDLILEEIFANSEMGYDYCLHKETCEKQKNQIRLIKLHGSINQSYCPRCGHILFHQTVRKKADSCPLCLEKEADIKMRPLIIAPTLFKSYSLPSLRNLWFQTLQVLSEAENIIFIGYSLPEADVLSFQLFDFGRKAAKKEQWAVLVNGQHLSPDRFTNIYGETLHNTELYFEEWISKQRRLP